MNLIKNLDRIEHRLILTKILNKKLDFMLNKLLQILIHIFSIREVNKRFQNKKIKIKIKLTILLKIKIFMYKKILL